MSRFQDRVKGIIDVLNENISKFGQSHPPFYEILHNLKYWKAVYENDIKVNREPDLFESDQIMSKKIMELTENLRLCSLNLKKIGEIGTQMIFVSGSKL